MLLGDNVVGVAIGSDIDRGNVFLLITLKRTPRNKEIENIADSLYEKFSQCAIEPQFGEKEIRLCAGAGQPMLQIFQSIVEHLCGNDWVSEVPWNRNISPLSKQPFYSLTA